MKPLLLVDGYNVIGAWDVPKKERLPIEEARERLVHLIADYAGFSGEEVIVVFDGHYTDRTVRSQSVVHGVQVVFICLLLLFMGYVLFKDFARFRGNRDLAAAEKMGRFLYTPEFLAMHDVPFARADEEKPAEK